MAASPKAKHTTKAAALLLACLLCLGGQAQRGGGKRSPGKTPSFPQSFVGQWKGKLEWRVAGKPPQTFAMRLSIRPTDSAGTYTWEVTYGDKAQDNRPYLLVPVDTAKGHWAVDERNGIVLDSYVHGQALHGAFTVQGATIVDNYRLERGKLHVEFFTLKLGEKRTSGHGTEDSPTVDSYRISSYQYGVLERN
jgi:hypothetical protein